MQCLTVPQNAAVCHMTEDPVHVVILACDVRNECDCVQLGFRVRLRVCHIECY